MKNGFVRVATFTPKIKVADVDFNTEQIISAITNADEKGIQILTFPELSITGYTCGDLFYSDTMINAAKNALIKIAVATKNISMLVFVGLPFKVDGKIYNVCAGISNGKVLGLVPKTYLPNYNEFYEKRYFSPAMENPVYVSIKGQDKSLEDEQVLLYRNIIFSDVDNERFKVSAEICEDLWTPVAPSLSHAINGARIIVNQSASDEFVGKPDYRRKLVSGQSAKTVAVYCYSNAGDGESTTDSVFSGHSLIAENGELLAQTTPFENGFAISDVDLDYIDFERSKVFNYDFDINKQNYIHVGFSASRENKLQRNYNQTPFIRKGEEELILNIQAHGLKKRLEHTNAKTAVIGLSGGLDSTLAIIVAVKAVKLLGKSPSDVLAFTMPCFGTTERTLDNSVKLAKALGVTIKKVDISKSVKSHLKDLGHSLDVHDAAYENAQARERTQVIMDIANMYNGVVVGTGDLSELALGWATYNGDHMSNYAVNASIPKTLVRHLVEYYAGISRAKLKNVLLDILDTPVSPELLPAVDSKISQKTEDLVGPYILHDFFIYNMIKRASSPKKTYYIACKAFEKDFDKATILKWLKTFVRRFFAQQFKRSCMPDGVKATEISFSPRGSLSLPSDAVSKLWLDELENL